jgi:phosphatidylserine/phosphatidylglycerophosphate/cardiolipin synthase-like enzyme
MRGGENLRTSIVLIFSLAISSCGISGAGGSFPSGTEESAQVTLPQLAQYYRKGSNGLIRISSEIPRKARRAVTFTWDPYDKLRIIAPFRLSPEVVQDLFQFDAERFVRESGQVDFITAANQFYSGRPFDSRKQTYVRPYRCLARWGSLFYPPIKHLSQPLPFYHREFSEDFDPRKVSSAYFDPQFQKQLDDETQTELTYGNHLRALFNGIVSYPEKLRLAREARKFLFVAVMTMVADSTGQELIRVMVNRKRAGVDVRLITDDFYTFSISNYAAGVLEREGIPVAYVKDKRLNEMDRMFHNKFWIRDGEEAILGGMNVLDYENDCDGFNFLNRDTDLLIRGPAVTGLLERYVALWKRYDREGRGIALGESTLVHRMAKERAAGVRGSENYARWLGNPGTRMNGICRTAVQADNAEPQKIVRLLSRYLEQARHSFYITSPELEFDPSRSPPAPIDSLAGMLKDKAHEPGFYAAYITNGFDGGLGESSAFLRSRVKDSQLVGESLWEDMLTPVIDREGRDVNQHVRATIRPLVGAGVHGFQYFNYIHAKEFYFDRILVGIGSWNFDSYSAQNNHESMIFCLDDSLRVQIEKQMVLDMINSVPIVFAPSAPLPRNWPPGPVSQERAHE